MNRVLFIFLIICSMSGAAYAIECDEVSHKGSYRDLVKMRYCSAMYFGMARAANLHHGTIFAMIEKNSQNDELRILLSQVETERSLCMERARAFGFAGADIEKKLRKK